MLRCWVIQNEICTFIDQLLIFSNNSFMDHGGGATHDLHQLPVCHVSLFLRGDELLGGFLFSMRKGGNHEYTQYDKYLLHHFSFFDQFYA